MPKDVDDVRHRPWDSQVANLVRSEGLSLDKARERVILDWLDRGSSKALAAILVDGYVPGPKVRLRLALMLLDDADADSVIARHQLGPKLWQFRYRLVIKTRLGKRGRQLGPEKDERGRLPAEKIDPLVSELGYEAAIERIDEAVRATGAAVRKQTTHKASDPRSRRKSKK
jgi:hypothetical protein